MVFFLLLINVWYDKIIYVYWFELFSQVSDVAHGLLVSVNFTLFSVDFTCFCKIYTCTVKFTLFSVKLYTFSVNFTLFSVNCTLLFVKFELFRTVIISVGFCFLFNIIPCIKFSLCYIEYMQTWKIRTASKIDFYWQSVEWYFHFCIKPIFYCFPTLLLHFSSTE